ncbi:AAA family ATPase [Mycoplasma sp. CSL7491-lung]|uniref:AAA domain-containing protein n=1 Tax=Mycoplasma sp. CSL7491-lung TaxID=549718 RepID=UPI001C115184|nr:AAA domain-containing protein [Mycoplasma sp. CSL7491-lung]MBU4692902.1 AAA family ATPase [Mycoplasma sp. CSL7491-lung]
MNLNIKINKNKIMNIGDAKQAETFKNRKQDFTVNDHIKKFLKSSNLVNKNMTMDEFFSSIESSIKSLYIINNDLFAKISSPIKVLSVNFLIFLSNECEIFRNQNNIAINVKTNFDESKGNFFELDRISILNNLEEEILTKYTNHVNNINLNFHTGSIPNLTNIDISIVKNILFDIDNDVFIMKTDKQKNNGMIKLGRTLDFYRDYIKDQAPKYNKVNDRKNEKIFPIVLRTERSTDKRTEFIFRITKREFNSNFVNIIENQNKYIYFYNINDSDEKVSINRQNISFQEYKYVELLKSKIKSNEDEIQSLEDKIKFNEVNFLNNDKKSEIKKQEKIVKQLENHFNEKIENLNSINEKIENLNLRLLDINHDIKKNDKEIKSNNEQINKIKPKKFKNKDEEDEYQKNLNLIKLEKNNQILVAKLTDNNTLKSEIEAEIDKLKDDVENAKTLVLGSKTTYEEVNDKFEDLKNKFEMYENENRVASNNKTKLLNENDIMVKTIENEAEKYEYYTFEFDNSKLGNLRAIDVKKIYDTNVKVSDLIEFSHKFDENSDFILSDEDYGMFSKHKRFNNSLKNFKSGEYKNPLLAKSIENPDFFKVKQELINNYDLNMHPDIKLNKKQELAVKKAILTPCISYLQGPPGTGKTQTISALIHHIINNKDQNVLLMSSTHEAILNAFDRIKSITEDDPNFIMYKTIRKKLSKNRNISHKVDKIKEQEIEEDESNIYDLDHAFYNFSLAIINWILKKNKNDILGKIIDKLKMIDGRKSNKHFEINKKIIAFIDYFKKNSKNMSLDEFENEFNKWTIEDFIELLNQFENEYNDFIKSEIEYKFEDIKKEVEIRRRIKSIKKYVDELLDYLLENKRIKDLYKEISNNNIVLSSLNTNEQKDTNERVFQKLQLIKDKIENREDQHNSKIKEEFSDYIYENELINLIGLTTTANQVINPRKDSNAPVKELFLQYPIYMTIVDEVSKSSTLEIINSCMLSEKILLAGDYKQLPPVLDFETGSKSDDQVESIEINKLLDSFKDIKELRNKNLKINIDRKLDRTWFANDESVRELISELKYPFFKFHALKLKGTYVGENQNFYTFLTEQHRFNESIQKVVNVNYDEDEKLTTPIDKGSSYLVNYKYDNIKINKEFIVMDTSKINQEFMNKYSIYFNDFQRKTIIENNYTSFDHTRTLDKSETKESTINEYNAFVIAEIVENIVLKNSNTNEKFDLDNIGIISMTRSQNSVIKKYLKAKKDLFMKSTINKVKVDTVDNFQGREKEIIIVDFVRARGKMDGDRIEYPNKRNYDFYKSAERINVAVSRAKDTLIMVGAFDELEKLDFNVSVWDNVNNKIETKTKKILQEYIEIAKDGDTFRKA